MTLTALDIFVVVLIVLIGCIGTFMLLRKSDWHRSVESRVIADELDDYLEKGDDMCEKLGALTSKVELLTALRDGKKILDESDEAKQLEETIRSHIDSTVKERITGLVDTYVKANTKAFDQDNAADLLQKTQPVSLTMMIPMVNLNILQRMVEDLKTPGRDQLVEALRYIMFIPCNPVMFNVANTSAIDRDLLPSNVAFKWGSHDGKDIITGCEMGAIRYNEARNNWVNDIATVTTTSKHYDAATSWTLYELTKQYPRINDIKQLLRYLMTRPNPTIALTD